MKQDTVMQNETLELPIENNTVTETVERPKIKNAAADSVIAVTADVSAVCLR